MFYGSIWRSFPSNLNSIFQSLKLGFILDFEHSRVQIWKKLNLCQNEIPEMFHVANRCKIVFYKWNVWRWRKVSTVRQRRFLSAWHCVGFSEVSRLFYDLWMTPRMLIFFFDGQARQSEHLHHAEMPKTYIVLMDINHQVLLYQAALLM